MTSYKHLSVQARSLTIFYRVAEDPVVESLLALLDAEDAPADVRIQKYSAFTRNLFEKEENLSRYIWELTALDENIYVRKHARKEETSAVLEDCIAKELQLLQQLSQVSAAEVKAGLEDFLPEWITEDMDFSGLYKERMDNLFAMGWGIYARHRMFTYDEGEIVPVAFPDPIELKALVGYQFARNQVVENTEAFLRNKPAANVLLYGDAGTGKSSTIKAIVNKLWHQGLRMIEIRKGDMLELPKLIHRLADNPLKFILFIDDLSFTGHNEDVGALKAILEGSVAAKTDNVLIYATSNRRHLVKETLSDRSGDDVHRSETMEEQTSLSDRFGLSIPFSKPDKKEYLEIVHGLADHYGLSDVEDLDMLAERFAIQRGGRSGRTARYFIESLQCQR